MKALENLQKMLELLGVEPFKDTSVYPIQVGEWEIDNPKEIIENLERANNVKRVQRTKPVYTPPRVVYNQIC